MFTVSATESVETGYRKASKKERNERDQRDHPVKKDDNDDEKRVKQRDRETNSYMILLRQGDYPPWRRGREYLMVWIS